MKLALIVLLFASPCFAQHDYLGHTVLIGGNLLDLATTRIALHNGAQEVGLAGDSLKGQLLVKAAFIAITEGLSHAAAKDGHPKVARNNRVLWGAGMALVALWNGHVIAEQHQRHLRRIH